MVHGSWVDVDVDRIWRAIVLALDEQQVRWYWCMVEFKCVITWCTMMRYDTIAIIVHSCAVRMPEHYNDDDTRFRIEFYLYFG